MDLHDARDLIRDAVPPGGREWADLGAGKGIFTRALVELLGPASRVHALDRDRGAIARLELLAKRMPAVLPHLADFSLPIDPPGGMKERLDGIVLGNSLHFVDDPSPVLARVVRWLRPGGRVVLIEYDRRAASRWVPHPIPAESWPALAAASGLARPALVARRRSAFGGDLYVAIADRG